MSELTNQPTTADGSDGGYTPSGDYIPSAAMSEIVALRQRVAELEVGRVHTCHANCQRPMCVMRRERDAALADNAALRETVEKLREFNRRHREGASGE